MINNNTVSKPSLPYQPALPLQVMSIRSSGVNTDPTTVTIIYAATPDHTTEWIGLRTNGGMWRTSNIYI
jgi:hypothetical protein